MYVQCYVQSCDAARTDQTLIFLSENVSTSYKPLVLLNVIVKTKSLKTEFAMQKNLRVDLMVGQASSGGCNKDDTTANLRGSQSV